MSEEEGGQWATAVAWQTAGHVTCSRHRGYSLSCEQFDALLNRSAGKCELCGLEGCESAWGILHIDHEHQVGWWAVRGLLCDGCNARLQRPRRPPPPPPLRRYLANAWYQQELNRLGLSAEVPPEPGLGSTLLAGTIWPGGRWMRIDTAARQGWAKRRGKSSCALASWPELWRTHGPFSLRVTRERTSLPREAASDYRAAFELLKLMKVRTAR